MSPFRKTKHFFFCMNMSVLKFHRKKCWFLIAWWCMQHSSRVSHILFSFCSRVANSLPLLETPICKDFYWKYRISTAKFHHTKVNKTTPFLWTVSLTLQIKLHGSTMTNSNTKESCKGNICLLAKLPFAQIPILDSIFTTLNKIDIVQFCCRSLICIQVCRWQKYVFFFNHYHLNIKPLCLSNPVLFMYDNFAACCGDLYFPKHLD